ncbi:hypothetical protein PM082_018342 [Marasmius tenuissimus]|nr:hypothetical protein PM082_018342 [Marasmius tenuissimus]
MFGTWKAAELDGGDDWKRWGEWAGSRWNESWGPEEDPEYRAIRGKMTDVPTCQYTSEHAQYNGKYPPSTDEIQYFFGGAVFNRLSSVYVGRHRLILHWA